MQGRRAAGRDTRRGPRRVAAVVLLALAIAPAAARHRARSLADLLDELQARGLNIIYSSAVVTPDMLVRKEPEAPEPRKALDEILRPFGLEARDDSSGAVLIVRAAMTTAAEPAKPRPRSSWTEDIIVTQGRHDIVPGGVGAPRALDAQDLTTAPTLAADPMRAVSLLPGIASSDASAAFYARGADTKDVGMIFDGLELYDPFHLEGFLRPFSFIDGRSVGSINVTTGGFTADRGDRNGGFVEMRTAPPPDGPTTDIEAGTLNSRVAFSTPTILRPLLVTGRYWYPEAAADSIAFAADGLTPTLGDLYVKAGLLETPVTVLTAHALMADDKATLNEADTIERVQAESRSGTVWLRHFQAWSNSVTTDTVISAGTYHGVRSGVADPEGTPITVEDGRDVRYGGLRSDATWSIDHDSALRAGIESRWQAADMAYASAGPGVATSVAVDRSGTSLGVYVAYRRTLTRDFTAEGGVRWDRQTYTGHSQWSPRLNLAWRPGSRDEVRFAAGSFAQSLRIHELRIEDGETEYRRPEIAKQLDLTWAHRFAAPVTLRIDAYLHRLSHVQPRWENLYKPVELFPEAAPDRVLVAPTSARLRGIEIGASGDPQAKLTWSASYVWSSATDVIDDSSVPRSWDQPDVGKVLIAYRWTPGWFVGAAATVHTGWPTTPVTLVNGEPVAGPRNSGRLPTYARLDLNGGRTFTWRKSTLRLELTILNATDRENACCVNEVLPTGVTYGSWLGITPAAQVMWTF